MIYSTRLVLNVTIALAVAAAVAQSSAPIFRYISIAPCGRLELDSVFVSGARATQQDDSTFRLVPRCFGGAQQLLVHITPTKHISSFEFAYGASESFAHHMASFAADLGPPAVVDTAGPGPHRAVWRDARTEFILIQRGPSSGGEVFSRLTNRTRANRRP